MTYGKMFSFYVPTATGAWVELTPALAGITDPNFLHEWERRKFFRIMSPDVMQISWLPNTDPHFSPVSIHEADVYQEFKSAARVYVNTNDELHVIFGY